MGNSDLSKSSPCFGCILPSFRPGVPPIAPYTFESCAGAEERDGEPLGLDMDGAGVPGGGMEVEFLFPLFNGPCWIALSL